ncbi:LysR family transcriptional regulator [Mesorhizobium sp.]|uniref:LysR family transcriptional regulator n=1 Tax=Mesorhizobium sp. TaxID=1871066 RepID=UPI000FE76512|nr:LysR family transcriptional regulator [Mesorhizobium sp.]RWK43142.1 MAG: LysR family transcriptional regulator [Mesorhizobium sp.]RWK71333.1 MAG: LysR family transcriptional regulator [Mesorhizobium sp.]RWK77750.1 MAG: LysR family transcriptional regulator [Mesorhizobium sp.]RWK83483.1 MAG: LysR family transcriptional regulator [Mesorhizobium sp.]RWL07162.1 MAG: LysR family transcriptional regulator [Mesorhizobium sp.]
MRSLGSISQIISFAKIAETGSLSKAARELNLTPSAVSKSLSQLEERLDVLLVRRTTRSLSLTEQGYAFFNHAQVLLEEIERAAEETSRFRTELHGTLRVTSSIAFGLSQLQPILGRYMSTHPNIKVVLDLNDRFVNLAEEQYDVAVRVTSAKDWNYGARELAPVRWIYCAAPEYIAKNGEPASPLELTDHKCLVYPAMMPNGVWTFRDGSRLQEVKVKPVMVCNSSSAILQAAWGALGVACLPTYVASQSIADGRLVPILPHLRAAVSHTLYAMYFESKHSNPLVRSLLDFLSREIARAPSWDTAIERIYALE